jgi:hypothetical protein
MFTSEMNIRRKAAAGKPGLCAGRRAPQTLEQAGRAIVGK